MMNALTEMSSTITSIASHSRVSRAGQGSIVIASKLKLIAEIGDMRQGNLLRRLGGSCGTSNRSDADLRIQCVAE